MSREITGVAELLASMRGEPAQPGQRTLDHTDSMFGLKSPSWGPAASLDAGDAGSRLGIDMGEPTVKAAALRHALLQDEAASLEKIALLPLMLRGARAVAALPGKLMGAGQKSRHFFARRSADAAEKAHEATATRRAAQAAKTQDMTPGAKLTSDIGFHSKEVGRGLGAAGMIAGGGALTAGDLQTQARDWRLGGRGVSGHGG